MEEEPPAELLQLMDEFERKNSHPVFEAICIRTLRSTHKLTQQKIARLLGVTKSTVCDTESIMCLPKEILDDALCHAKIAKRTLIRISRMKASDQDKTAAYELAMSNPHDARHTYATLLLMAHRNPAYVQHQLGYSSISITIDVYGHWIPGQGREGLEEALSGGAGCTQSVPKPHIFRI